MTNTVTPQRALTCIKAPHFFAAPNGDTEPAYHALRRERAHLLRRFGKGIMSDIDVSLPMPPSGYDVPVEAWL